MGAYEFGSIPLPVTFGTLGAVIRGGQLFVNWSTETEKNNSRFIIELSKDGKTFVAIDSVNTLVLDGNSDKTLQYSFRKALDLTTVNYLGMSVNATSLLLLSSFIVTLLLMSIVDSRIGKRNKVTLLLILAFCTTVFTQSSCKKYESGVVAPTDAKLWVRIVQVDKDGLKHFSKIIQAVVEN